VLLAQEGDLWIVTIGGYLGDQAPLDPIGFLDYAKNLPQSGIYDVIKESEPLSAPVRYKFMASQRRCYEHLTRFPGGFLVFADAICSFNPVYGQGMTVTANEAMALQQCLQGGSDQLAQWFFKRAGVLIDAPWYVGKLHEAAHADAALSVTFLHVVNIDRTASKLAPSSNCLAGCARSYWQAYIEEARSDFDSDACAGIRLAFPVVAWYIKVCLATIRTTVMPSQRLNGSAAR
jgi:hypothetical protein